MSPSGTNLPIWNVRFHGESWRVSGRATEIAKATFMTLTGPRRNSIRGERGGQLGADHQAYDAQLKLCYISTASAGGCHEE